MPAFNAITPEKLARLVGTPACPAIVDVRSGGEALIPGSIRRPISEVARWSRDLHRDQAVLVCVGGGERSAGAAAWLRHEGLKAEVLEGGFEAWTASGLPVVDETALPARDGEGRTLWVTRARPKIPFTSSYSRMRPRYASASLLEKRAISSQVRSGSSHSNGRPGSRLRLRCSCSSRHLASASAA